MQRFMVVPNAVRLVGGLLLALAPLPLAAQSASLPELTVFGSGAVGTLKDWPGISVSVDRDAWVVAFAVTRGKRVQPIQVLSPTAPGKAAWAKRGERIPLRRLNGGEALHLVNYGEQPIVLVYASATKPDLAAFADGKLWARDLFVSQAVLDQQEMVDLLGKELYGPTGEYAVLARGTREPSPRGRYATDWTFDVGYTSAATSWTRRVGPDGLGLYGSWEDVDPAIRTLGGSSTAEGQALRASNGAPVTLKGGAVVSILPPTAISPTECLGYRVAWWPRFNEPIGRDSTLKLPEAERGLVPRYPGVLAAVGTVPGPSQLHGSSAQQGNGPDGRSSVIQPYISTEPAILTGRNADPQAARSVAPVAKPSDDGTYKRPPGR